MRFFFGPLTCNQKNGSQNRTQHLHKTFQNLTKLKLHNFPTHAKNNVSFLHNNNFWGEKYVGKKYMQHFYKCTTNTIIFSGFGSCVACLIYALDLNEKYTYILDMRNEIYNLWNLVTYSVLLSKESPFKKQLNNITNLI